MGLRIHVSKLLKQEQTWTPTQPRYRRKKAVDSVMNSPNMRIAHNSTWFRIEVCIRQFLVCRKDVTSRIRKHQPIAVICPVGSRDQNQILVWCLRHNLDQTAKQTLSRCCRLPKISLQNVTSTQRRHNQRAKQADQENRHSDKDSKPLTKTRVLIIDHDQDFRAVRDACKIHKEGALWLFEHYLSSPDSSFVMTCVILPTKAASGGERGLISNSTIVNDLLK